MGGGGSVNAFDFLTALETSRLKAFSKCISLSAPNSQRFE